MNTTTYSETEAQPGFVTQVRRLSKDGFVSESNSKSPRLDKMIAHINLFERTTKHIEDELTQEREYSLSRRQTNRSSSRPGMGARATEYEQDNKETPVWVTELTSKPSSHSVVVTEVEEVEDVDED